MKKGVIFALIFIFSLVIVNANEYSMRVYDPKIQAFIPISELNENEIINYLQDPEIFNHPFNKINNLRGLIESKNSIEKIKPVKKAIRISRENNIKVKDFNLIVAEDLEKIKKEQRTVYDIRTRNFKVIEKMMDNELLVILNNKENRKLNDWINDYAN